MSAGEATPAGGASGAGAAAPERGAARTGGPRSLVGRVRIVSASAGTGKTTRLAREIVAAVDAGTARPEAVLATTFTNRAAAELLERAREELLRAGRASAAERLAAARIGTVNSVCGGLVQDFAFELGLSPRVRVLDERQSREALRHAQSRALSAAFVAEIEAATAGLREFRIGPDRTMGYDWQDRVHRIVDLARVNAIPAEHLPGFARRSADELDALLGAPASDSDGDGDALDRALDAALARFAAEVDTARDTTKKTRAALGTVRAAAIRGAARLRWTDCLGLAGLAPGKKSDALAEPVREAAAAHDRHPRLRADLRRVIELVFEAAGATLDAYARHKRRMGVIDFVDQEAQALAMLAVPALRERLRQEIDLVLVDEFQDTSPIQLAIFLRLAELADASIWVGDPKQAIYGFRGADPELMEAAVGALLAGAAPEMLGTCYRSRAGLVDLASDLFGRAFAESGIPEERVRVKAHRGEEPDLGPAVERWVLHGERNQANGRTSTNKETDAAALAAGVAALLRDPDARVLDRASGMPRPPRAGDVAVLCPTHCRCRELAGALARAGLRSVVARTGLLATLEGRLALAALRLWVDPRDALARAELARWLEHPEDGDAWLERLLAARAAEAPPFDEIEPAARLRTARREPSRSFAGVLAAFDAALTAAGVRERAAAFGDGEVRLANLGALRARAAAYVDLCRSEGTPCTLAGLLAHLDALAAEEGDEQAASDRPDAVYVGTWHGAKGLEWPVTVLADLGAVPEPSALDVALVAEGAAIDLARPLAGRWIRFWPDPYAPKRTGAPLYERLADHPATRAAHDRARREGLRLLYVGWTRARDRLVLAARPGQLGRGRLGALAAGGAALLAEPAAPDAGADGTDGARGAAARIEWAGRPADVWMRALAPGAAAAARGGGGEEPEAHLVASGPRPHPPAFASPSSLAAGDVTDVSVGDPETLGERIPLTLSGPDADARMRALGDAVHGFFAADRPALAAASRLALARGCLTRFGVPSALAAADLVRAADDLQRWIDGRWPGATWHREWPLAQRLPTGTLLRGQADLVLELPDHRLVLLDHKTFPGSRPQAAERAKQYAGQLGAYARALRAATGQEVAEAYVHLPVSGLAVRVAC